MKLKWSLSAIVLASLFISRLSWAAECPMLPAASKLKINQRFFAIGTDFSLVADGQPAGKVVQKILRIGKTFELLDSRGQLIAVAHKRVVSLGVKIDVRDCHGQSIGGLQENILKSVFKTYTVYSVLDGRGELVGQSKKLDFFGTDITFYDSSGQVAAGLSRGYWRILRDSWTVTGRDSGVDMRVLAFAAVYKTLVDGERGE